MNRMIILIKYYLILCVYTIFFFFSSRRRHTRLQGDWSSDVCSSDLPRAVLFSACVIAPWCWSTQGWHGMAHLEHGHHARQALRLVAEGGGRRCGLLDRKSVV